ncbi:hypothetical protein BJY59DRAFT_555390 [Rhodotorula toruloides]
MKADLLAALRRSGSLTVGRVCASWCGLGENKSGSVLAWRCQRGQGGLRTGRSMARQVYGERERAKAVRRRTSDTGSAPREAHRRQESTLAFRTHDDPVLVIGYPKTFQQATRPFTCTCSTAPPAAAPCAASPAMRILDRPASSDPTNSIQAPP